MKLTYVDDRVLDVMEKSELVLMGFVCVPHKWVTNNLTQYKVYLVEHDEKE